jgi:spore coat protein CotH
MNAVSSASQGTGGTNIGGISAVASSAKTYPRPCADIYDQNVLPTFEVEIAQAEWDALVAGCPNKDQSYHPITLHYGSESKPASLRLKGNWSWNCDKLQFAISFNETDPNGRFHGLRKIVLDAPWYDKTLIHERLAFAQMRDLGTPYSCVNNARLVVNGAYYGLYANVERVDREYLERNFAEPDGNLYKAGRELTTNEDTADTKSVDAFWASTKLSELDGLVDLNEAVQVWAGLAMLPDPDSYWAGVEINFYLYQHPTRGLLFIPYDMDTAFSFGADFDPITYEHSQWKREKQYQFVLSDSKWCNAFVAALKKARDVFDVPVLEHRIDVWSTQVSEALSEDPHAGMTAEQVQQAVGELRQFPSKRAAFIDKWLAAGGHCPPAWP